MSDVAQRIFQTVKGDNEAIQGLAVAVAGGDTVRVQQILKAKGLEIDTADVERLMTHASAETQPGSNMTMTMTMTFT